MGNWSIYSVEEEKSERTGLKAIFAGRRRSHSFLALVDDSTKTILRELHFGGYSADGSEAQRYASNPMNMLATVADNVGLSRAFMAAADKLGIGEKIVRLKGIQTGKRREFEDIRDSHACFTGKPENAIARWNAACKAALVLNEADIPTLSMETPFSSTVNCRSGTRMALEVMGLPPAPVFNDYKPGWGRRLRDEIPALREILPEAGKQDLQQLLDENMRLKYGAYFTRPQSSRRSDPDLGSRLVRNRG